MKRLILLLIAVILTLTGRAQLSDAETAHLAKRVRANYEEFGIDGAKIYQTRKHWVLVSVVTVTSDMRPAQLARLAQVKATRTAVEFLEGVTNTSITVYDASSNEGTSLTERNSGSDVNLKDQTISASTTISANEQSIYAEHETLSDKIAQSSIAHIDGLQTLLKITGTDGELVYAYYMVISKQKAKKK
ncbi:MAG: hypothetical protein J6X10_05965 [Bacteroidales bacterium]|nr:hypothetical protein [Bacteroidales bacterium]